MGIGQRAGRDVQHQMGSLEPDPGGVQGSWRIVDERTLCDLEPIGQRRVRAQSAECIGAADEAIEIMAKLGH